MKGIILAGGSGTRLHPITHVVSKQLLPVYNKPMIYYPLSILMQAGIKEILVISTPEDLPRFISLLGDGSKIGLKLEYIEQPSPDGLAQAFILGEEFIGNDDVSLILGDNILYGGSIPTVLSNARKFLKNKYATIFGYEVRNPNQYGVVEFDCSGNVVSIEEKPEKPKSNYAAIGLYFYPNDIVKKAKSVIPSDRGELEITSVNEMFMNEERLKCEILNRGNTWLDTGSFENLLEASQFVETIEKRSSFKVGCIEEIAYKMGFISKLQLLDIGKEFNNSYGLHLIKVAEDSI
tara:strand:+ start:686 stop:1561 length:876 start_codon:yes stop_codon:yes gene_type:complete